MTDHRERVIKDVHGLSNIRIECPTGLPHDTSVTVNGVPITGIVAVRWELESARAPSRVYLTIEGASLEVTAEYVYTKVYGPKKP